MDGEQLDWWVQWLGGPAVGMSLRSEGEWDRVRWGSLVGTGCTNETTAIRGLELQCWYLMQEASF